MNGSETYSQTVYTPKTMSNTDNGDEYWFTVTNDKYLRSYSFNRVTVDQVRKVIELYLTTRCACGNEGCHCSGGCGCAANCACSNCRLSDRMIDTGYGIVTYKEKYSIGSVGGGYNLRVNVFVNGEQVYWGEQMRLRCGEVNCLNFTPKDGYYYYTTNINGSGYELKTLYSGSSWVQDTGYIQIVNPTLGEEARNYDNVLNIYLATFENWVRLDVSRWPGKALDHVYGYTVSYQAWDPETKAMKTWSYRAPDFNTFHAIYIPKYTQVTVTGLCSNGWRVDDWYSIDAEMAYNMRLVNPSAVGTANGWGVSHVTGTNSVLLVDNTTQYMDIRLYIYGEIVLPDWPVYTVTFMKNRDPGTNETYKTSRVYKNDKVSKPTNPTWSHHSFNGWFLDKNGEQPYDFSTKVTGNLTLYGDWSEDPRFTVSFDTVGGSDVPSQVVYLKDTATKPAPDPTWAKHRFAGWYTDTTYTTPYDFSTAVTQNITVYAKWLDIYTVTFDTKGGSAVASQEVVDGNKAAKPGTDPTWAKHQFDGWYADEACTVAYNFNNAVHDNITIYAKWLDIYTVTFDTKGGSVVPSQEVLEGSKATQPAAAPTRGNDIFDGWYADAAYTTPYDFNSAVTSNITIHAKWINVYTVSFNTLGGTPIPAAQKVTEGGKATEPETAPSKTRSVFGGWYTDEACTTPYDFDGEVHATFTLYAKWTEAAKYTVTFDSQGGSDVDSQLVYVNETAEQPDVPTRTDWNFGGWYTDAACTEAYDFDTPVTADITLYARWTKEQVTVTFNSNGGSSVPKKTLESGEKVPEPDDPTRSGYVFDGWYTENTCVHKWDFNTPVTKSMTLWAKWVNVYQVKFFLNIEDGETAWATQDVRKGDLATEPEEAPTREGRYDFGGWHTQKTNQNSRSLYDFSTPVTSSRTLYAQWIKYYTVVFDTVGADEEAPGNQKVHEKEKIADPNLTLTREGFIFDGWSVYAPDDSRYSTNRYSFNATNWLNFVDEETGVVTLYAKWIKAEYTVTGVIDRGQAWVDSVNKDDPNTVVKSFTRGVQIKPALQFKSEPGYVIDTYTVTKDNGVGEPIVETFTTDKTQQNINTLSLFWGDYIYTDYLVEVTTVPCPRENHLFTYTQVDRTCELNARKIHICTVCGYVDEEGEIVLTGSANEASGHTLPDSNTYREQIEGNDEYHKHLCQNSWCDGIDVDGVHESKYFKLEAHEFDDWTITKYATATDPVGEMERVCSKCHYVLTKPYIYGEPVTGLFKAMAILAAVNIEEEQAESLADFFGDLEPELPAYRVSYTVTAPGKEPLTGTVTIATAAVSGSSDGMISYTWDNAIPLYAGMENMVTLNEASYELDGFVVMVGGAISTLHKTTASGWEALGEALGEALSAILLPMYSVLTPEEMAELQALGDEVDRLKALKEQDAAYTSQYDAAVEAQNNRMTEMLLQAMVEGRKVTEVTETVDLRDQRVRFGLGSFMNFYTWEETLPTTVKVKFDTGEYSPTPATQELDYGQVAVEPVAYNAATAEGATNMEPYREGYMVNGWYYIDKEDNEVPWNFDNGVTRNMILYPIWERLPSEDDILVVARYEDEDGNVLVMNEDGVMVVYTGTDAEYPYAMLGYGYPNEAYDFTAQAELLTDGIPGYVAWTSKAPLTGTAPASINDVPAEYKVSIDDEGDVIQAVVIPLVLTPDKNDDKVPDKYQAVFVYEVAGGNGKLQDAGGNLEDSFATVVTLVAPEDYDVGDGKTVTVNVVPGLRNGIKTAPDAGYCVDAWTPDVKVAMDITGGNVDLDDTEHVYRFVVTYKLAEYKISLVCKDLDDRIIADGIEVPGTLHYGDAYDVTALVPATVTKDGNTYNYVTSEPALTGTMPDSDLIIVLRYASEADQSYVVVEVMDESFRLLMENGTFVAEDPENDDILMAKIPYPVGTTVSAAELTAIVDDLAAEAEAYGLFPAGWVIDTSKLMTYTEAAKAEERIVLNEKNEAILNDSTVAFEALRDVTLVDKEGAVIMVFLTRDKNEDKIPDKYQARITYQIAEADQDKGDLAWTEGDADMTGETVSVVITLTDGENYVAAASVAPGMNGVSVVPETGYAVDTWTPDPMAETLIVGGNPLTGELVEYVYVVTLKETTEPEPKSFTVDDLDDVTYNGEEQEQAPTVKDGDTTLVKGTDYTISYSDDTTNVGTVTVTITGMGNYEGETTVTYQITPASVLVKADNKSKKFGEADPELTATVTGLVNGESVTLISYTVTRTAGENVDEYPITANGAATQGNYTVTYSGATFAITAKSIEPDPVDPAKSDVTVENPGDVTYNGQSQEQKPVIKDGDKVLVEGVDYELEYSEDTTNAGTVTVTVIGKGNYEGTIEVTYQILPKEVTVTFTPTNREVNGSKSVKVKAGKLVGVIDGDDVSLKDVPTTGTAASSAAGTHTVTVAAPTLTGEQSGNYTLTVIVEKVTLSEEDSGRPGGGGPVPPTPPVPPPPVEELDDEDVPLANVEGLNTTDHYAYLIGYEGLIRPTAEITRAEVATIFFRLMTPEYRNLYWSTTNDFSDVNEGDWFNNAISTCAKAGIIKGYPDGSCGPNNKITRAEFAAIAARFATLEYDGVNRFADVADDYWAVEEINTAAICGWIDVSGKNFRPLDNITRAEVVKIIDYMLDRIPDNDGMLDDMITWPDNMDTEKWYYALIQEATNTHTYKRDEDFGVVETWTALMENPNWAYLEEQWADPAKGPSIDVMKTEESNEEAR